MSHYAEVAVNAAVNQTFHYHIPPQMAELCAVGVLVRVGFGTAQQAGIIIALADTASIEQTKPILSIYDREPVVTPAQIETARWLAARYLCPLGVALWVFLPPGIVGARDVRVRLLDAAVTGESAAEQKLIAALGKRALTGQQIKRMVKGDADKLIARLKKRGIVATESMLRPPTAKPKRIHTAALNIAPSHLPHVRARLGKSGRLPDALRAIIDLSHDSDSALTGDDVLAIRGVGSATLDQLLTTGAIERDGDSIHVTPDAESILFDLRGGETDAAILRVLARENEPVAVSWVYAQTGATLTDLKRLEANGLILLGEDETIRDSLAGLDFAPVSAPRLTAGQSAVWRAVRGAIDGGFTPSDHLRRPSPPMTGGENPTLDSDSGGEGLNTPSDRLWRPSPPMTGGENPMQGGDSPLSPNWGRGAGGEGSIDRVDWRPSSQLWGKLKPIANEMRRKPTKAEKHIWKQLQKNQLGVRFRRQHPILHYIVDFFCLEARLIVEIDGKIHEHQQEEDQIRQEALEALGLRVIRFTNDEVFNDMDDVIARIKRVIAEQKNTPSDRLQRPSPRMTGGENPTLDSNFGGEGLNTLLLHGVTGAGKTEIYLRAIERTIQNGRGAILLVPEIALTPQTIRRVLARFPERVAIVHSRLSEGERYDTWRRARAGEIDLVVGTRSALFTPLPDVGLIVIDEEHDSGYKQSAPVIPPYYHARDVADYMMRRNGGLLILGSATPDVETRYRAERGEIGYLRLPDRIMGHRVRVMEQADAIGATPRYTVEPSGAGDALTIDLPPVDVIDMREELIAGNVSIFSRALHDALRDVLKRGQQAILFLNRRGTSTHVFCRDCGAVVHCPRCDLPMTYHADDERLHCHHCDHRMAAPQTCANCGSQRVRYFGAGTQHIETAFKEAFPAAVALRWDSDAARGAGGHDLIMTRFLNREADVLIGTQMIAKGLDLPLVTLVGVVSADVGLNLPDFRAAERSFQLLAQVAGRAGRGTLGGRVILQTYQPEHPAIVHAANHDYEAFYRGEVAARRAIGYPPFRRLVRVLLADVSAQKAQAAAEQAAAILHERLDALAMTGTEMIGPVPCFYGRLNRVYRWQVILRGGEPLRAFDGLEIRREWSIEVDPVDLL